MKSAAFSIQLLLLFLVPLAFADEGLEQVDRRMQGDLASAQAKLSKDPSDPTAARELARAKNYFELKKRFGECKLAGDRKLDERILSLSAATGTEAISCQGMQNAFDGKFAEIRPLMEKMALPVLQDKIYKQALLDQATQYWALQQRFPGIDESKASEALCKRPRPCTDEYKSWIDEHVKSLESRKPTPIEPSDVIRALDPMLSELNTKYRAASKSKSPEAIEAYRQAYRDALASEYGFLLRTDAMIQSVGDFKEPGDPDAVPFTPFQGRAKRTETVKNAARDALKTARDDAELLSRMNWNKLKEQSEAENGGLIRNVTNGRRDLRELTRYNPVAVSQVLINEPEYAPYVCDAINSIPTQEQEKFRDTLAMGAGVVAGLGLGLASGGTLPALAATTAYVTGGEMGYHWLRGQQFSDESRRLSSSFVSGTGDVSSIEESQVAAKNYEQAHHELVKAGVLGPASAIGGYGAGVAIGKAAPAVMKSMTATFQSIASKPVLAQQLAGLRRVATLGKDAVDEFVQNAAKLKVDLRERLFKAMEKLPTDRLKSLVKKLNDAGKGKCG